MVMNFKYENDGNGDQLQNNADELQALQTKLFASEFIQEIVQTKSRDGTPKPPCVILYTDEQIAELRALCMTRNNSQNVTTMGVDRTFNLGPCYVTTVVYKNTKLIRKTTQDSPIFLGPLYLHWDADFHTYHRFFSHLQAKLGTDIGYASVGFSDVVVGSDEERAIVNVLEMCFPGATVLLCMRHVEENVRRKLTDIRASRANTNDVMRDIFGDTGISKVRDADEFDRMVLDLRMKYEKLQVDFVDYFDKLAEKIRQHAVLPHIKHNTIPLSWTNNNCESLNHILKMTVSWRPQRINQLVDKLHDIVKLQMIDARRALRGQGNFELAHWVKKFRFTSAAWDAKSQSQKDTVFKKFNAYKQTLKPATITSSDGKLTIPKTPTTAKKPGQRQRIRPGRTVSHARPSQT